MTRSTVWDPIHSLRQRPEDEEQARLRACPVFDRLPDRGLQTVRSLCHVRHYKEDEHIFRRNEPGVGMYILLEGAVEIYRNEGQFRRKFADLGPGDFFGELALLEEQPRTASARSEGYSRILGFFRPDLLGLLDRKPRLAGLILMNMARLTARRLINTNRELEEAQARMIELEDAAWRARSEGAAVG